MLLPEVLAAGGPQREHGDGDWVGAWGRGELGRPSRGSLPQSPLRVGESGPSPQAVPLSQPLPGPSTPAAPSEAPERDVPLPLVSAGLGGGIGQRARSTQ